MSLLVSASNSGLSATSNLSNPQSCTKTVWAKMAGMPSNFQTILNTRNSGFTAFNQLFVDASGVLNIGTAPGTTNTFGSSPTYTDWVFYAMTAGAAGAGSLIAYYQDNAGGGLHSASITGSSFTASNDEIAANLFNEPITFAYYKEWSTVLSPTQLQAEFLSAAPVITGATLRRDLVIANAASAGVDSSGNGFGMATIGTVSDGVGSPTFPFVGFQPFTQTQFFVTDVVNQQ